MNGLCAKHLAMGNVMTTTVIPVYECPQCSWAERESLKAQLATARDEALELAAKSVLETAGVIGSEGFGPKEWDACVEGLARRIRRLKSKP